jgi:hypothetical protein
MFRLLKLAVGLMAFVAIAWFGMTVQLGSRTLFGHLYAIGQTKASQDLVDGTKRAAGPLVDDVKRHWANKGKEPEGAGAAEAADSPTVKPPTLAPDAGPPQEKLSSSEQRQLRRLLGAAEHHAARE